MTMLNPSGYYRSERAPYYIVAPSYVEHSSGIRVLNYLCHILNLHGYEAYVSAPSVNDVLWVPQLTEDIQKGHYLNGRKPIVVYPEVVHGTPLGYGVNVRYLLNIPGFIGGSKQFREDELLFAFRSEFVGDTGTEHILLLPTSDISLFNPGESDSAKRQGRYFYYNRYLSRGGQLLPETSDAIEISPAIPRTLTELSTIFKSAELLYCYEESAIALEARLCGCPVVYIPNPQMLKHHPEDTVGADGSCWGKTDAGIQHAKNTVSNIYPKYLKLFEAFNGQLSEFISITQNAADVIPFEHCYPEHLVTKKGWPLLGNAANQQRKTIQNAADREYAAWSKRKSLQEIDGQILAEHMSVAWKSRPHINILVDVRANESHLLADTIDSLAAQWYPNWHLTIVADCSPDNPVLAEIDQITWAVREPGVAWKALIDTTIDQTPSDWLLIVEPGDMLEPHALAYFADTINLNPRQCLIYSDADTRDQSGNIGNPQFKPDFNLELLRNMYYLGSGIMVKTSAYQTAGGWSNNPGNALHDLSLRIIDHFGTNTISHLPEVLLHNPTENYRQLDSNAEIEATSAHLQRNGISAEVLPGFLTGTQMVRYRPTRQPLVSIIIPTRDQPGYLAHCVDSLIAETTYQNWELIIVDHDTYDPDALDYIEKLTDRKDLAHPAQCVRTDGKFNYARLCNLGVTVARGEHLLFLDNDTEIIQPSWMENLLAYLEQDQVAAVAPRLSKPDSKFPIVYCGPRVLGLASMAGGIAESETNLIEPGYCGRLQIAQDVSALSGSCFMVKAATFHEYGGFNEIDTPVYEPTLDLCIKLRKANHRLIWTPWVDVVHHGGITKIREESDAEKRIRFTEIALKERDYLYDKYIKQLANDPFYHRQLSLSTPFAVEPHAVIDWDTRFHDRLRILGLPLTSGSGEYRMVSPFRALQKAGIAQTCIVHPVKHKVQRVLNPLELARAAPDVLMLQQSIDDTQIAQLKRYRRFNREVFITYAVDDVLGNLPRKHYLYNYQAREGKSRMREGLSHCDRLIASTQPIADYCRNMIDDIVVVPNRLEGAHWQGHESKRGMGKKPRVGWAGAQQHLGDLEMIKEVVETLRSEVEWVFMGMCPDFLKPHVAEDHPFVSFKEYPAKLASLNLDLAIAPLEQHLFNEGKSNLRLLEYGIMGWPVVCTDIYPYQTNNAPVKRVQNKAAFWIEAIRERINDLEAAYKEGEALRAWVMQHYLVEDHTNEWLRALTPRGH